jgi:hypothetical protein
VGNIKQKGEDKLSLMKFEYGQCKAGRGEMALKLNEVIKRGQALQVVVFAISSYKDHTDIVVIRRIEPHIIQIQYACSMR